MSQYFSFKGFATRSEYWGVMLLSTIATIVLILVGGLLLVSDVAVGVVLGFIILFASIIGAIWIQLATIARRCRDIGINPWFTLSVYIPYIGFIVLIVFGCIASEKKEDGLV